MINPADDSEASSEIPHSGLTRTEQELIRRRIGDIVSELSHQTGNSFQRLCSLLYLIENGKHSLGSEEIRRLTAHIRVLADLNEFVSEATKSSLAPIYSIDVSRMLERIVSRFEGIFPDRVRYSQNTVHSPGIFLTCGRASSFGIICNELIDYMIKYSDGLVSMILVERDGTALLSLCATSLDRERASIAPEQDKDGLGLVNLLAQAELGEQPRLEVNPAGALTISLYFPVAAYTA